MQALIQTSGHGIEHILPPSIFRSLLVDGVWSGVGAVIVFLPQILLLFLFIGILEDSGYLARAALIADRTMAKFGLQGKSFIPLLSAYACAVPAIMATRTIENKRDRLATILIAPFMTCSARLPVYTLIIAAFIADRPLLGHFFGMQAGALLGLYVLGFVAAIVTARLLKSSILKSERAPFILEMPPYRWPTLRSLGLRLIDRSKVFLRRAGHGDPACDRGALGSGKPAAEERPAARDRRQLRRHDRPRRGAGHQAAGLQLEDRHRTDQFHRRARSDCRNARHHLRHSEGTSESVGLRKALQSDLTPGGAVALLVFFAFAMQCMSTIAVVRRETGGWRWPAIQFAYMTFLAYVCAMITNEVVRSGIFT